MGSISEAKEQSRRSSAAVTVDRACTRFGFEESACARHDSTSGLAKRGGLRGHSQDRLLISTLRLVKMNDVGVVEPL